MPAIENSNMIPGVAGTSTFAGVPSAGTSKIQTLTFGGTITASATSGFYVVFGGQTSGLILWSATNATLVSNIDAAVELMANVGTSGVTTATGTITSGIGTITVTSAGNIAALDHATFTVISALEGTSPTVDIAETTAGVTATFRGAVKGKIVSDTTNGVAYINTGTAFIPTWTKIGTQT